jgi:hypothetical protein
VNTIFAAEPRTEQREQTAGSSVLGASLLTAAYERHAAALVEHISASLVAGDWHRAEDVAGEVWLSITENIDRVDARVLELSWLQMIARSVVRATEDSGLEVLVAFTGEESELAVTTADGETAPEPVRESGAQTEFRRTHGSPVRWSAADFESYENLAAADSIPVPFVDTTASVTELPAATAGEGVRAA